MTTLSSFVTTRGSEMQATVGRRTFLTSGVAVLAGLCCGSRRTGPAARLDDRFEVVRGDAFFDLLSRSLTAGSP